MKKVFFCAIVLTAGLSLASQNRSNVAGDWDVSYSDGQGPHTAAMRLEQTGERIKGTVRGRDIQDGVIEGNVEGNRFGFDVRFYNSDGSLGDPTTCSATVDANSMKGLCRDSRQTWAAKRRT